MFLHQFRRDVITSTLFSGIAQETVLWTLWWVNLSLHQAAHSRVIALRVFLGTFIPIGLFMSAGAIAQPARFSTVSAT